MSRHCAVLTALAVLVADPGAAQSKLIEGYYQNVALWSAESPLFEGGLSDFNRFRLMSEPAFRDFSLGVAYEQVATFRKEESLGLVVGGLPGSGEWLDLQWTIQDEEHVLWQHRFDRLQVGWTPSRRLELTLGRQAMSWATTLFLTPADPFSPFDPADPFREFRAGVDAARVRVYPGPLSEIDIVVRPTENEGVGDELTALGRGLATWKGWELSAWGGSLYGDVAGAFGAAGSVGAWAIRGEGVVRDRGDEIVVRGTIGIDHRFGISGRDLYVVVEYQRDGLAAASPDGYLDVLQSKSFLRGELQVLGRDETAVSASYQIHPLWSLAALWIWNLDDKSALLSPSFSYSASDEATIAGGLFFGVGSHEVTTETPLPSEYGLVATTAYLSFSLFF